MKGKLFSSLLGGLTLLFSSTVTAHIAPSGEGVTGAMTHLLTGPYHLPMLALLGVGVVYFARQQRRRDD